MPYKYKLPSGQVIEADTAQEIKELVQLFENQKQSASQDLPVSTSKSENTSHSLIKVSEPSTSFGSQTTLIQPPSVEDFVQLWERLETERARNVMQLFSEYGKKHLTSKQLAKHLGVERVSGTMSGINKRSEEIGFSWKRWFPLISGVYEVNDIAYENLVKAMHLINT